MDMWQVIRQLRWKLKNLSWTDSPQDTIFSQVVISDVPAQQLIGLVRHPFVVIHTPNTTSEAENPLKAGINFDLEIYTENNNDRWGEAVILGAVTDVTSGSSVGRGIMQLDRVVKALLSSLGKEDGVRYWNSLKSSRGSGVIQQDVAKTIRVISFSGGIWEAESYTDATGLTLTQSVNDVVVTWDDPPQRFDTLNLVVRRKAGSNPTGPTDGSAVGTPAYGDETITDTAPGAGTWYYGVFVAYDSSLNSTPTTATDYSDGLFGSITVT